jgi:hypothetical protein
MIVTCRYITSSSSRTATSDGTPPAAETDRDRERSRLMLHQFHAFPRLNEFNTIFRADRLFQRYMVDAAANIE